MDQISQLAGLMGKVSKLQGGGETLIQTLERIVDQALGSTGPVTAPATTPAPETPTTAGSVEPTKYRFKTNQPMNASMAPKYTDQWRKSFESVPGLLNDLLGVTPDSEQVQAEMNRVYQSGSDDTLGVIDSGTGRIMRFCRLMIEPVG